MIATLRNRNFVALWLGGLISLAGDWVLNIGLPIYIFLLTHSFAALSIIVIVQMVPSVLFGSVAGVFVDRWDRKRTLVVTNVLLALGLLPLLLVRAADLVWIVYIVGFFESCIDQFTQPALSALLPAIVREERIVSANSLLSINSNLARLGGPALGGLIAGVFGLNGIVTADGISFAIAALLILTIAPRPGVATASEPAPSANGDSAESVVAEEAHAVVKVYREWVGGLAVVVRDPMLRVLFAAITITALGEGVMGVLYVVYVNVALHGGAQQIGALMSAQAIGGLAGGLLFGALGQRVVSRWIIGTCAVLFGLIDLAIFNAPHYYSALVPLAGVLQSVPVFAFVFGLFVAVGIPGIGMMTGIQSRVQTQVPQAFLGRVFGVMFAFMAILGIVGSALAGIYAPKIGTITMLNIQGGGYVVAGLVLLFLLPRGQGKPLAGTTEANGPAGATEETINAPA